MRVRALVAAMILAAIPIARGQSPSYNPPRTPDGHPSFEGFWTNSTYTPLERPDGVNKEFYTAAEFADIVKRANIKAE